MNLNSDVTPVTVQIMDKEYRIACSPEEQHALVDCARMLDKRMREVRQNGRVIGADRIAVMAALNLLYEALQQREGNVVDRRRLANLQARVSAAVAAGDDKSAPTAGVDASGESV